MNNGNAGCTAEPATSPTRKNFIYSHWCLRHIFVFYLAPQVHIYFIIQALSSLFRDVGIKHVQTLIFFCKIDGFLLGRGIFSEKA